MEKSRSKTIIKVGIVTMAFNVLLAIGKLIAGLLAHSSSLISDAMHSASDVLTTIVVMIGAKIAGKKPDKDHPFGHERMESIASIILGMILVATGVSLGYNGIENIIKYAGGDYPTKNEFIYLALGFAIASIVVQFIMFLYSFLVAKKIKSTSLKADSFHHLSDSLSSFGSILGVVGIMIGGMWSLLDPIASVIIALFILKVAYDILKEAIAQVVDKRASEEFEKEIREFAKNSNGVLNVNKLKTRQFADKIYVELSIAVDPNITVKEGHDIGSKIHHELEDKYHEIKHINVHIDPEIKNKD